MIETIVVLGGFGVTIHAIYKLYYKVGAMEKDIKWIKQTIGLNMGCNHDKEEKDDLHR